MTDKTGGSAFPRSLYTQGGAFDSSSLSQGYGMTLRDYFAAKAMQALLMQPDRVADAITSLKLDKNEVANHVSLGAYHFADAMLKAREQ